MYFVRKHVNIIGQIYNKWREFGGNTSDVHSHLFSEEHLNKIYQNAEQAYISKIRSEHVFIKVSINNVDCMQIPFFLPRSKKADSASYKMSTNSDDSDEMEAMGGEVRQMSSVSLSKTLL